MLSTDLKNQIINLPVSDRLELMQAIVTSLQNPPLVVEEETTTEQSVNDYFEPGKSYEVWTPIDALKAAQVLLDLLAADARSTHE